ncbi:MAG: hypothetical protein ABEI98_10665 [Halorhabdus sp.]
MAPVTDDIRVTADRLLDALDIYDQFVDGVPYERHSVPREVEAYLADWDAGDPDTRPGVALATRVRDLYHRAREAESTHVHQARERGRRDWSRIAAETEPVREAARWVHKTGYGTDPETGEESYLLPEEQCPAQLVSMNPGLSPVVYEDRVAQYRAVADRFDLAPEVVYHPGSGHDVSLSRAFPESRVVYVDVDVATMTDLDRAGYEAVDADATGYELTEGADVIVFRNVGLFEEAIVETNLRPGGWVLANDHLESASHVARMDSLELVGIVPDESTGNPPSVDTVDFTASPSPIETGSPLDLYVFRAEA